jgi:hypothetical protein
MVRTRMRMPKRAAGLIALAVLSGIGLTACGQGDPGIAATIGDDQLTIAQVQERTAAFFKAYPDFKSQVDASVINAITVENFLRAHIVDLTAADLGIEPTQADLDQTIEDLGGMDAVIQGVSNGGVPPDPALIAVEIRSYYLQFEIGKELADDPNDQEQVQIAAREAYLAKGREAGIEVNPRYGTWDGSQVQGANASISIPEESIGATPAPVPGG